MNLDKIIAVRNDKTVYRDGNRCLKIFNEDYSKTDVLNEALNQARVEEIGLHVPKILEVSLVDGKWAVVSEFIKGDTLAQLMKKHPEKTEQYMEQFVELHLLIHSKTCPVLNRMKDIMRQQISQSVLSATIRYGLYYRLENMPKHNKLCHGDFNPSNIIIAQDGTPYILDWSQASRGNASADAAQTYLSFCMAGERENALKYLELICSKSGIEIQSVQRWLPIAAAAQSIRSNEQERKFLLSQIKITD